MENNRWKYLLILVVVLFGTIYALPNIFPQDPAVQISASRSATVDEALEKRVQAVLEKNKISPKASERTDKQLLVRLGDANTQLVASDLIRTELGDDYNVALNLASTVPAWLHAIGGKPMTLGLDLQGGVSFLLEVDQSAAVDKLRIRYADDVQQILRDKKLKYREVAKRGDKIIAVFASNDDRAAAANRLAVDLLQVSVADGTDTADSFQLEVTVRDTEIRNATRGALTQNVATLRNRINSLGVAEPIIQQQGDRRIVVQLPGVQDTAFAKKILGGTATLEYRAVDEKNNVMEALTGRVPPESRLYRMRKSDMPILLSKKTIASGDELVGAEPGFDPQGGSPMVSVTLNSVAGKRMQDFTTDNVGNRMAVVFIERNPKVVLDADGKPVLDAEGHETFKIDVKEEVISAAVVQGVFGRKFQTSGLASSAEASELALMLKAGSLAAPVVIVEERVVGPSLGKDNIVKGFQATLLGLLLVVVFVAIYYKAMGLIADFALTLNLILLLAVLSLVVGATLTMPGIAGIVLTLGMAIDANVLICERVREELRNGSTPLASLRAGYEKAWATILDANVTHVIAALGLMTFGSGAIKGFAVTLFCGILTSVFTSVTITHAISDVIFGSRRNLKSLPV